MCASAAPIARQITEALEAAHERGIVHRDLKPANVKITPKGTVKLLDFGVAKMTAEEADGTGQTRSGPMTVTVDRTGDGRMVGTAAYMSPEQVLGQSVDTRTDIWAFGCVLYELLTGQRPFACSTVSDTIAAIIDREPDWQALPVDTPPDVRELLRRCLPSCSTEVSRAPSTAPTAVPTTRGTASDRVVAGSGSITMTDDTSA